MLHAVIVVVLDWLSRIDETDGDVCCPISTACDLNVVWKCLCFSDRNEEVSLVEDCYVLYSTIR